MIKYCPFCGIIPTPKWDGDGDEYESWEWYYFDMDEDERTTPVHIVIHPTIEDGNGWRNTDGETYTRLFSYYPATGLTIKYEEDDDE